MRTAFTMLNIALFAPTPTPNVTITSNEKAGRFQFTRAAKVRSCISMSSLHSLCRTQSAWGKAPRVRTTRSRRADALSTPA